MIGTWEEILTTYRNEHFEVYTREEIIKSIPSSLLDRKEMSEATRQFLVALANPDLSLWQAFLFSVQSVYPEIDEESCPPLKTLLTHATRCALLYGEHFAWRSPEKWSYLIEVHGLGKPDAIEQMVIHPPASQEDIALAEQTLQFSFPPSYRRFLCWTNGLGLAPYEIWHVCGVGKARAAWEDVLTIMDGGHVMGRGYHEITWEDLGWHSVLSYERERDLETDIPTFISDDRLLVSFADTYDIWCFDRSQPDPQGEYPVNFWDHELCEATPEYPSFEAWLDATIRDAD